MPLAQQRASLQQEEANLEALPVLEGEKTSEAHDSPDDSSLGSTTWCTAEASLASPTSSPQPAAGTCGPISTVNSQAVKDLVITRQATLPYPGSVRVFITFLADANIHLFVILHSQPPQRLALCATILVKYFEEMHLVRSLDTNPFRFHSKLTKQILQNAYKIGLRNYENKRINADLYDLPLAGLSQFRK